MAAGTAQLPGTTTPSIPRGSAAPALLVETADWLRRDTPPSCIAPCGPRGDSAVRGSPRYRREAAPNPGPAASVPQRCDCVSRNQEFICILCPKCSVKTYCLNPGFPSCPNFSTWKKRLKNFHKVFTRGPGGEVCGYPEIYLLQSLCQCQMPSCRC
ncbi:uncharacterized protein [Heliangelus exortis]|uniref:uncharacterized protein isoform X2 n=1 Tax=Heliangelus exortis TaxID=472823 RepID=UPI003A933053